MAENKKFLDTQGLTTLWAQVKSLVSNYLTNFKNQLNTSGEAAGTYVDVTVSLTNGSLQNGVEIDESNLISKLNDLTSKASTAATDISNIKAKTGKIDVSNNKFTVSSKGGVHATNFTTSSGNLNDLATRLASVETTLTDTPDADTVINKFNEVIAYFKDVQESTTGGQIIADVADNTSAINSINSSIKNINNKLANLRINTSNAHSHSYTPAGTVSIGASYSNGIVTLTGAFSGTTASTTPGGSHDHSVNMNYSGTGSTGGSDN